MDPVILFLIQWNDEDAMEGFRNEKIRRRILRDQSNVLNLPKSIFIQSFRVNKEAFIHILNEIEPFMPDSSIPTIHKLSVTLRFLAEGSYQRAIGKDFDISLGRSTISKVISLVLKLLEKKICNKWIKLNMSEDEKQEAKRLFLEKFGIPGVIGCVDGTHVKILKPSRDGSLYFNRKGYHSINAVIICDHKMRIRSIDATRPGSSHDALIWHISDARGYFLENYENGGRGSWLLGDSGFALEPFLITPYKSVVPGTFQASFNTKHSSARNIIERVIGMLKARFRCLLNTLYYKPKKASQIINVCCCIHNICQRYNSEIDENIEIEISSDSENENFGEDIDQGRTIRDAIAQSIL